MKKLLEVVDFTDLGEVQSNLICIEDNKENREILLDFYSLDIEEDEKENFMKGNIDEIRDCSKAIRLKIYEEEIEKYNTKKDEVYKDYIKRLEDFIRKEIEFDDYTIIEGFKAIKVEE